MVRRIFLSILTLLLPLSLCAQSNHVLKVKLTDSLSKEPVASATILLSKSDTADVDALYSSIDEKGVGFIKHIPGPGKYYFKATLIGYKDICKEIEIKERFTDLGELFMNEDVSLLESVVVEAVGNTMVVKQDTLEYNASLFKVSDNAMLEDLLKKLPGVDVDKDGKVTVNGEEIKKVMIDGKEFFLNDPKLATKNIPANVVHKVRVLEKKSKQAEFTGIDDGEEQTIIDLTIKPGMMNTWFGNLSAGGGMDMTNPNHDGRFQASGLVGNFSDKLQISFIANGNNTNNRGFNEMAGEMGGGARRMMKGMWGGGITTSWMGGANVNYSFSEGRDLGGNYLYDGSIVEKEEHSRRTSFIDSTQSLVTDKKFNQRYFNDTHRAGVTLDYKFNDRSSIYFNPNFYYSNNNFEEKDIYNTENTRLGKVNDGHSMKSGKGYEWNTDGQFLWRQRIGRKPGRTISLDIYYDITESILNGDNKSLLRSYADGVLRDSTNVDQYFNQIDTRYSASGNLTYTEPLGRNFFLLGSYRFRWSQSKSEKMTYDRDTDIRDDIYSNRMQNDFMNHNIQLSLKKQEPKYSLQIGVNAQPFTTKSVSGLDNSRLDRDTTYTMWNFAPSARFDYKFSRTEFIRLRYNGRTSQPSIEQMMPAPDNSNPLYISLGNPSLKPQFRNRMRFEYRNTNTKTFTTYSVRSFLNYTKDNITNAKWYDGSGVQYSVPVNAEGGLYGADVSFMINAQIRQSGFSLMSYTSADVSSSKTYTGNDTSAHSFDEIKDKLIGSRTTSLSVSEHLALSYRNNWWDSRIGGRVSYNNAWYEIATNQRSAENWVTSVFANINVTLPWGMEIATDINYKYYIGYARGFGDPVCIWNAELSQAFLKNRLSLKFKVYDILNQAKNNYRTTTENYIEDSYNNTLGQYFMFTLVYRFGNTDGVQGGGHGGRGHGGRGYRM